MLAVPVSITVHCNWNLGYTCQGRQAQMWVWICSRKGVGVKANQLAFLTKHIRRSLECTIARPRLQVLVVNGLLLHLSAHLRILLVIVDGSSLFVHCRTVYSIPTLNVSWMSLNVSWMLLASRAPWLVGPLSLMLRRPCSQGSRHHFPIVGMGRKLGCPKSSPSQVHLPLMPLEAGKWPCVCQVLRACWLLWPQPSWQTSFPLSCGFDQFFVSKVDSY